MGKNAVLPAVAALSAVDGLDQGTEVTWHEEKLLVIVIWENQHEIQTRSRKLLAVTEENSSKIQR